MAHHHGLRTVVRGPHVLVAAIVALTGCDKDKMAGPEAEVRKNEIKINLPPVPAFDLPPSPDNAHTVKEMRVKGKKLLDTEVTVKGVITWVYDCRTAIRQPDQSDKDLEKTIEEDPSRCDRPKFYLGDTANTPPEKSLWVVDVPRPYYKIELQRLPRDELRNPPPDRCDPKRSTCPPYKVGDEIEVTGTWKLTSQHSERNSDGLLVYKRMKNLTETWESPASAEQRPGPQGAPSAPSRAAEGNKRSG